MTHLSWPISEGYGRAAKRFAEGQVDSACSSEKSQHARLAANCLRDLDRARAARHHAPGRRR